MPSWIAALSIAVLVATVPCTWVFRILNDLPRPLLRSHRRWPDWANFAMIGLITADVTVFIRTVYYGRADAPLFLGLQFVIAAGIYIFGIVLLLRQFAGLYPDYFVTTGRTGLGLRKALYRNIAGVDKVAESGGETRLRIRMQSGEALPLELPTHRLGLLHEAIQKNQPKL